MLLHLPALLWPPLLGRGPDRSILRCSKRSCLPTWEASYSTKLESEDSALIRRELIIDHAAVKNGGGRPMVDECQRPWRHDWQTVPLDDGLLAGTVDRFDRMQRIDPAPSKVQVEAIRVRAKDHLHGVDLIHFGEPSASYLRNGAKSRGGCTKADLLILAGRPMTLAESTAKGVEVCG